MTITKTKSLELADKLSDRAPLLVCTPDGIAYAQVAATKVCARCGLEKNREAYNREVKKKDGLSAWCKACKSVDQAKRRVEILAHDPAWLERRKTFAKLARLIEKGAMEKPKSCPQCKKMVPTREMQAKFKDGRDPFTVEWRCRACALAELGKSMTVVCRWCDEPFKAQTHQLRRGAARYCSVRCRNAWMKKTAEHVREIAVDERSKAELVYLDDRG